MKIKFLFLLFILLISFVSADVLVNTKIDKEEITNNEVALLTVKVVNDSTENLENYVIRIETTDNLVLLKNEQSIYAEVIEEINAGEVLELKYPFKAVSTGSDQGRVFAYYGEEGEFAAGTFVNIKSTNILIKTNARKVVDEEGQKIIVDFEAQNYSNEPIFNLGAEVIAPEGFEILSQPIMIPVLEDANVYRTSFEILSPLRVVGDQRILVSYGYFDENIPHYFEESHIVSFEDSNRFLLAGIGFIVLVIAILIYMSKTNAPQDIKGTKEKEAEK
jgi:hypothetical protein